MKKILFEKGVILIKGQSPETRGTLGNVQIDSVDTYYDVLPRPAGINAFWAKEEACCKDHMLFETVRPRFVEELLNCFK